MEYFVTKYDVSCQGRADCVVLDDSIMIKGSPATAGSKMLENFISPIDATVVSKLADAGVQIIGKTVMDEFGAGGIFIDHERHSETKNTLNQKPATMSGAVAAVENGPATFALCNDYTGAVSLEAAAKGLYYIHPTYGTVSRYGLIPAVASMDQIGIVCKSPEKGFKLLSTIAGYDEKDGVMTQESKQDTRGKDIMCIGVQNSLSAEGWSVSDMMDAIGNFDSAELELAHAQAYNQIMQILCCAELSNNISRYDGIKFGYRTNEYNGLEELYTKSRTEAFGFETKLAATVGAMVLSHDDYEKLYDKAMKIRRLIKDSIAFDKYDLIVTKSPCLARLCGLPALTMPYKGDTLTLIANAKNENILMSIAKNIGNGK